MLFWTLLVAIAVVFTTATKIFEEDYQRPAVTQAMIDEINSKQTMWKAAIPVRFANATVADVKRMLGTIMPGEEGYEAPELEKNSWATPVSALPTNFDARTQWSNCAGTIGRVRDQSNCGSCWAFGSTEALNDRHCIAGNTEVVLSPEDTNSCCSGMACSGSMGCNGGQPAGAWKWFTATGVSTGGDWADNGKGTTCKPYSMQSCAHHVEPPAGMVSCSELPSYKTPKCTSSCNEKEYGTAYKNDKFFAKSHYSVKADETAIMQEIYEKGTVSVALSVYEDFESYTSGVYKHVSGKYLGGHAIKMIGWGVEGSTKYWICVNSWNDSWGEKGIFRILRGVNECGIEGSVVAGDV